MKKTALFTLFMLAASRLFAQTGPVASAPAPVSDIQPNSTKSAPNKTSPNKAAKAPSSNITDDLSQEKSFSKFFKVLQTAGLRETFKSKGPITMFVPDDSAFQNISAGKLDTLSRRDHRSELIALVTYHAIAGNLSLREITKQINRSKNSAKFTTLSGGILIGKIDENGNVVFVDETSGKSIISKSDIQPGNGSLFVINRVLIPKDRLF